jgi:hypothetical protein
MGIKENFKAWTQKLRKENPEKLKQLNREKKRRWRAKKKAEKRQKEAQEVEAQFKAGNLNYGMGLGVPKAMSWHEFKQKYPKCDFWDFIDYKRSLKKPKIEKVQVETQNQNLKAEKVYREIEGELPNTVQTGFNFFHPEQEKSDLDLEHEKQALMDRHVADIMAKENHTSLEQEESTKVLEQLEYAKRKRNLEEDIDYSNEELPPETTEDNPN